MLPSDPPIDQLILSACSVKADRLQELPDWLKTGKITSGYNGPIPTYKLRFDWRDVEPSEEQFEAVNVAMGRCYGS